MRTTHILLAGLLLGAFIACGGGGGGNPVPPAPPVYATRLTYAEPPATGWRFTKVAGTGTAADPLVLELRGPSLPRVKGVAYFLDLGTAAKVAWASLGPSTCIAASTNLNLGAEPRLLKDKVTGTELQAGVFQKSGDADPGLGVVSLGLKLNASQGPGPVVIAQNANKAVVLNADGSTQTPLTIAFGTIQAE
jgi:hypothetical protein